MADLTNLAKDSVSLNAPQNAALMENVGVTETAGLTQEESTLKDLLLREMQAKAGAAGAAAAAGAASTGNAPQQAPSQAGQTTGASTPAPKPKRAPMTFTRVQPGDLITASYVNGLIEALHLIDLRLIAVESNETVRSN